MKLDVARTIGPFRALDHAFAIRAPEPLRTVLADAFADLRVDPAAAGTDVGTDAEVLVVTAVTEERWDVHVGGEVPSGGPLGWVVAHVLEVVNQRAASSLRTEVPLHAASVLVGGTVVALAGSSGAGKSTLAAAAVLGGLGLVADEVSAVTAELHVRPYHRPVGLRRGGAAAIGVAIPEAPDDRFGRVYPWRPATGRSGGGPLSGIALVGRQPGPPVVEPVRPAPALAELMHHTIAGDERLVALFRQVEDLVRRVPVARLTYDDPAEGVAALCALEAGWRS